MPVKFTKVAVHSLIRKNSKILISRRSELNNYMPGYWDFPGGSVEHGEHKEQALRREIMEETGLRVKIGKIISVFDYLSGPDRHQWQLVFECQYVSGRVKLNPEEHDRYKWISLNELGHYKLIAYLKNYYKETVK